MRHEHECVCHVHVVAALTCSVAARSTTAPDTYVCRYAGAHRAVHRLDHHDAPPHVRARPSRAREHCQHYDARWVGHPHDRRGYPFGVPRPAAAVPHDALLLRRLVRILRGHAVHHQRPPRKRHGTPADRLGAGEELFGYLKVLTSTVWTFYPIVVFLGCAQCHLISKNTEDCLLCLLDITAKLGVEGLIIAFAVFRAEDAEGSDGSA